MRQPIKFMPYFKSTIWGGDEISRFKGLSVNCNDIGESWELSAVAGCESIVTDGDDCGMTLADLVKKYKADLVGREVYGRFGDNFPLLVKLIDARDNLSLQVHPNDELARKRHNSPGKTEMWYVLDAKPNARIHAGLTRPLDSGELNRRLGENSLMEVVKSYDSEPGALFYLPAGKLHAIGTGNFLVEIQQSSDITYRVDDYNRTDESGKRRELHTAMAREAIDCNGSDEDCAMVPRPVSDTTQALVKCNYFDVNRETVEGSRTLSNPEDSFMGLVCIGGSGRLKIDGISTPVKQGETLLLPAGVDEFGAEGSMVLLTVVIPSLSTK